MCYNVRPMFFNNLHAASDSDPADRFRPAESRVEVRAYLLGTEGARGQNSPYAQRGVDPGQQRRTERYGERLRIEFRTQTEVDRPAEAPCVDHMDQRPGERSPDWDGHHARRDSHQAGFDQRQPEQLAARQPIGAHRAELAGALQLQGHQRREDPDEGDDRCQQAERGGDRERFIEHHQHALQQVVVGLHDQILPGQFVFNLDYQRLHIRPRCDKRGHRRNRFIV